MKGGTLVEDAASPISALGRLGTPG